MIKEFTMLALRNISHRKKRTALTIIGIFIGITAVVGLISLGQGLQDSIQKQFQQIGSDKLFINPGASSRSRSMQIKLTDEDLQAVENTRGIGQAAGIIFTGVPAEYHDRQEFVVVLGTPLGPGKKIVETSWAIEIKKGRKLRKNDRYSVVLGSDVARSIFDEKLGIRSRLEIGGKQFRVVGISKPTGDPGIDRSVMMPLEIAQEITGRADGRYDWIFAKTQEGIDPSSVEEEVEKNLRQERNVKKGEEDFAVSTQEDILESFNNILNVVRGVVVGIASISLLVGGVNIMNTMFTSVTERTREIGVMKAVGASKRQILTMFLIESAMIGFLGGLIGVTLGLLFSTAASMAATAATSIPVNPYLSPLLVSGALVFSTLVGIVAGVLPARKAARLPPAEALRYE